MSAERSGQELAADVKALNDLMASRGWALICEVIDASLVRAAMEMASDPRLEVSEYHYRRGAMFATAGLRDIPQKLKAPIENEMFMKLAADQEKAARSESAKADPT